MSDKPKFALVYETEYLAVYSNGETLRIVQRNSDAKLLRLEVTGFEEGNLLLQSDNRYVPVRDGFEMWL